MATADLIHIAPRAGTMAALAMFDHVNLTGCHRPLSILDRTKLA